MSESVPADEGYVRLKRPVANKQTSCRRDVYSTNSVRTFGALGPNEYFALASDSCTLLQIEEGTVFSWKFTLIPSSYCLLF
jgi:hypothetical protein